MTQTTTTPRPAPESSPSAAPDDSRVVRALEEYAAALQRGERPDRAGFLAGLPAEVAAVLAGCLDGLELVHAIAPELSRSDGATAIPDDLPLNQPLGDFRLIREVGRGGMGVVYEAEQLSLSRRVALKVLPFAATMDAKHLQRFKNEAKAAASLRHEHIVHVYGVGCERGVHYYAMEFIEGQTLAQLIHALPPSPPLRGRGDGGEGVKPFDATSPYTPAADAPTAPVAALSTERGGPKGREFYRTAAGLIAQAADALEHAHGLGIVHRDVKPGNLLLDAAGKLYVGDFGLARFGPDAGLTVSGDLLGTLRYMAPEQVLARHGLVDHRADVYALGCTFYELLTGRPAVDAADRGEVLRRIAFEEPAPPRQLAKSIPAELETITLKCLAKDPAERYATAGELADDLRRWLADQTIKAKPPSLRQRAGKWVRRHRYLVWSAVAVLAVTTVVFAVSTYSIWRKEQQVLRAYEAESRQGALAASNLERALQVLNRLYLQTAEQLPEKLHLTAADRKLLEQVLVFYEDFARENDAHPSVREYTVNAHIRVGNVYSLLGQPGPAIVPFRRGLALWEQFAAEKLLDDGGWSKAASIHTEMAQALSDAGRVREADAAYRQALDLRQALADRFPDEPQRRSALAGALNNLARRLRSSGDAEGARRLLERAIEHQQAVVDAEPHNATARHYLANHHANLAVELRNLSQDAAAEAAFARAGELYERLTADFPTEPSYRFSLAWSYFELGTFRLVRERMPEAEAAFRKSLPVCEKLSAEFPGAARYTSLLRDCVGNLAQAVESLQEAEELYRRDITLSEQLAHAFPTLPGYQSGLSEALNNLALVLCRRGEFRAAIPLLERAIGHQQAGLKMAPEDPTPYRRAIADHYWILAAAYRDLGDYARAKDAYDAALQMPPKFPVDYNAAAWFLATCPDERLRDPPRAVELAKKAVAHLPQDANAWGTLGAAHYRAGDWPAAAAALEKSRSLRDGDDPEDLFFRAMTCWQLGNKDQARQCYDRAVQLMEKQPTHYKGRLEDLRRFRAEAAELLGIKK